MIKLLQVLSEQIINKRQVGIICSGKTGYNKEFSILTSQWSPTTIYIFILEINLSSFREILILKNLIILCY